ncbi:unnamed protein product [Nesidiocoris tenuis]|uniref:Uncharacterized protein n=1 Tax=Nesidiocoris tenuis TaxID=355587 RepID=A0A6H5G6L0_9HEMI|nr:unnamed protein product [Nesidiocoris tenuis]
MEKGDFDQDCEVSRILPTWTTLAVTSYCLHRSALPEACRKVPIAICSFRKRRPSLVSKIATPAIRFWFKSAAECRFWCRQEAHPIGRDMYQRVTILSTVAIL